METTAIIVLLILLLAGSGGLSIKIGNISIFSRSKDDDDHKKQ